MPFSDGYVLRETKASTFPLKKDKVIPDKPEENHVDDLAIQAWVYQASGWPLACHWRKEASSDLVSMAI
jgi:hypothetical protein